MPHEIAGGEDQWHERPFVSNSHRFVVPPVNCATGSCKIIEAERQQRCSSVIAGLSGCNVIHEAAGCMPRASGSATHR